MAPTRPPRPAPPAPSGASDGGADGVTEGGGGYQRTPTGWRRAVDGEPVAGASDLTLRDLFDPPLVELGGEAVRLVPRAWASRHPDHPLAWTFEHAELGGRGAIPVPAAEWDERAGEVVAMAAPVLHPWNLVGTDGVAAILGVAEATVRAYLARRQMPEPLVRLGRTPVWSRDQIEAWRATRRPARRTPVPEGPADSSGNRRDPHDARGR